MPSASNHHFFLPYPRHQHNLNGAMTFAATIHSLSQSAPLRLAVAVLAVLSGVDDLLEQLGFGKDLLGLDVHHGLIVYALLQALKALSDILGGLNAIEDVRKKA